MDFPIVSVVMSVFNGERFLCEAVDSILAQSIRELEFIIVDDGSTDSSGSIIDSYQHNDTRIRAYYQENKGLVESLNRGCGVARGKYIARMDADDIAVKDRLMRQVEFMENHPEVAVLGGAVEVIDATRKALRTSANPLEDRDIKLALLRGDGPFCHPTVLMRKDVLFSVGGYRKVVVDAEDYDLWLRIADCYQLANLEAVVLKYRVHPYQVSVRKCRQQGLSALAALAAAVSRRNGNPDPLDSIGEVTPAVLSGLGVTEARQQTTLARWYLARIRGIYAAGDYSVGLNLAIEMFQSCDWKCAERWPIADARLMMARLYWCQRRFARSILATGHALITRPTILGRPFKPLLRRLRLGGTLSARLG